MTNATLALRRQSQRRSSCRLTAKMRSAGDNLASIDLGYCPNDLFSPRDLTNFPDQLNLRVRQDEAARWVRSSSRACENRRLSIQLLKLHPRRLW